MNDQNDQDIILRKQLVSNLKGGEAFSPIDSLIDEFPFGKVSIVPDGLPYSFYQQFYHIWFAQHDIIEYCLNEDYKSHRWPDDYWPDRKGPGSKKEWNALIEKYLNDRYDLEKMIMDTSINLFQPVPSNTKHNLFREVQLVIEHTAYHTGQLYLINRLLRG